MLVDTSQEYTSKLFPPKQIPACKTISQEIVEVKKKTTEDNYAEALEDIAATLSLIQTEFEYLKLRGKAANRGLMRGDVDDLLFIKSGLVGTLQNMHQEDVSLNDLEEQISAYRKIVGRE